MIIYATNSSFCKHDKFTTFVLPLLAVGSLAIRELGWISSDSPSLDSSNNKSFAGNFSLLPTLPPLVMEHWKVMKHFAGNGALAGDGAFAGDGALGGTNLGFGDDAVAGAAGVDVASIAFISSNFLPSTPLIVCSFIFFLGCISRSML